MSDATTKAGIGLQPSTYLGYAELDLAAIRAKLDRPLALWYLARVADSRGSGTVPLEFVKASLKLNRASARRVLALGRSLFWELAENRIYLASPGRVAKALDVPYLQTAYEAPIDWLTECSKAMLRARLALNAFAVARHGKPVATATIAHACSVSRRTVFHWLRLTGWGKIANLVPIQPIRNAEVLRLARKYAEDNTRLCTVKLHRKLWLAKQLPNSFEGAERKVRRRSALRRANRYLATFGHRGRGQRQRLYHTPKERRTASSQKSYTLLKRGKKQQLWESPPPSIPPL